MNQKKLKKEIDKLEEEWKLLTEKASKMREAIRGVKYCPERDKEPSLHYVLEILKKLEKKFDEKRWKIADQITELQKKCKHKSWSSSGHDSHYDYEKCDTCGIEERA